MLDNINNSNDYLIKQSLQGQSEVGKVQADKNPLEKYVENNVFFEDQTEISEEAVKLFERAKDVEKFKNMVLQAFDEKSVNQEIAGLISADAIKISDEELSESMLNDSELLDSLFSADDTAT